MRSSPETAIIEQPTAATKLPSATSTTTPSSDAIDAAVSTQQPAATPATSSDASDTAVASQQPVDSTAKASDKVDSVQDVTDFTQTLMKDTCHADRKRLKCTMYCFFLAVVVIMDGRRDGALWDDIYDTYRSWLF